MFGGNPAAVVPLETALDDDLLLAIAAQHNLSETAYFEPQSEAATDFAGSLPRLRCDCADTRPSPQRGLLGP